MNTPSFRIASVLYLLTFLASLEAAPPAAPSDLVFARSEGNDLATLQWVDKSNDETRFQFELSIGGGVPFVQEGPGADLTSFTFVGFAPGTEYVFRIRAVKPLSGGGVDELEVSEWTSPVTIITENYSILASAVTATQGLDFTYSIQTNFDPELFEVIGTAPSWLSLDQSTGILTGVAPAAGSYRIDLQAEQGINQRSGFLYVNVINEGPAIIGTLDSLTIIEQPRVEIDLDGVFDDPDFIRAAAISTNFGDIVLGFYEGFPVTVDNFFAYVANDAWDGAFFHRMAKLGTGENFVLQGGGFRPGSSEGNFERVFQLPAIVNEFDSSRANICGTISMAKLGGNPDSATNQFFISLNDNRANLDLQNGGFTVFGRAADIEAANRISGLPSGNFSVNIGGITTQLGDWPLTMIDGTSPTFDQLALMSDVVEVPTLAYSFGYDGDDVVVAEVASVVGAPLVITPTGTNGRTQVTITATDLDGASVSSSFEVTVLNSYAVWAARELASGPDEASDSGTLTNFEEYAYGGDPDNGADDSLLIPFGGVDADGFGTFTFRHRNFSSDLNYSVETSSNLSDWDPIWTTAEGFEADQISNVEDDGEIKVLTIRRTSMVSGESPLFFRLIVTVPAG